jgi:hypothetical protein
MGGTSSSSQTQSSQLAPYSAAAGPLNGLLGSIGNLAPSAGSLTPTQSGAINQITANSNGQPNYAPQIQSGTYGLLNGGGANDNNAAIKSNYGTLNDNIGGIASSNPGTMNPALKAQLDQIASDTRDQVNGSWAAAGRDGSPGNVQALARGIASGEAPVIANQFNTDTANKMAAAGTLYNGGNTTYGILNGNQAAANQNFQNGVGTVSAGLNAENAAPNAALQAASQAWGIPVSQLTTLLGAVSPVAQAFGTQNGTANGSQTMSGAQQFGLLAGGLGSLMPKAPLTFNFGG